MTLPESVTGKPGENITIEVNVTDEFGNPVTCDNLTVTFPDGTTAEVTYDGTSITVPLPENMTNGDQITVSYPGDDKYNSSNSTTLYNSGKLNTTTILPDNVSGKPGQEITIPVNITDENGNSVIGDNVTVTFPDGSNVTVSIVNGSIIVTLPENVTVGNITVNYLGDDKYNPSNNTTVLKLNTTVTLPDDINGKPGQNLTIPVNITNEDNITVPVTNVTVTFPDGSNLTVPVVNGFAILTLPENVTTGDIFVTYLGDDEHNPSNSTIILNLTLLNTTVTLPDNISGKPGQNVIISLNVTDENSNPVISGNMTVTLPNGSNISVDVVNGSAIVNTTVPKGTPVAKLNISAIYNGNNKYSPSNTTGNININPLNTNITLDITEQPNDSYLVNGSIVDENGDLVANDTVDIIVSDKTFTNIHVDENGKFQFVIPAINKPGDYNITINYYLDNGNYLNSTVTKVNAIVVKGNNSNNSNTNDTNIPNGNNGNLVNSNEGNLIIKDNNSNNGNLVNGNNGNLAKDNSSLSSGDSGIDMKSTGNPIAMLLLALLTISFGFKRKF